MSKILCATRGGEASYKAQDAAITYALKHQAEVLFLFVVDTAFLDKTARAIRRDTVTREMDHMAEFLLMMALERAKTRGVPASLLIRHGDFRAELIEVARDPEVIAMVLGKPEGNESLFSHEGLEAFAREVEEETQTRVILAEVADEAGEV